MYHTNVFYMSIEAIRVCELAGQSADRIAVDKHLDADQPYTMTITFVRFLLNRDCDRRSAADCFHPPPEGRGLLVARLHYLGPLFFYLSFSLFLSFFLFVLFCLFSSSNCSGSRDSPFVTNDPLRGGLTGG